MQKAEPTIDDQTWPQGFTLSRMLSPKGLSEPIYILRSADGFFFWSVPQGGDPVGRWLYEYEAAQDALSVLEA